MLKLALPPVRTLMALMALMALAALAAHAAQAQTSPAAPTDPTPTPTPTPAPAAAPAAATPPATAPAGPARAPTRIEIIGGRESDTDQRRQSTAAKIIIGREEIEKFGDSTLGEVLRRLPGVTTPGAPGRGGPPRLRGLGSGFTQLLIDGQRLPPGFSLDSLTPEQVERIEILRAPTAETGARAIAGTINIITREGFKKRLNDLRVGTGIENGKRTGGSFWTHNESKDELTYTLSAAVFGNERANSSFNETQVSDVASSQLLEDRATQTNGQGRGVGTNLNARLQWRLGPGGDSVTLTPGLFANRNHNQFGFVTDARKTRPSPPEYAAHGSGGNDNSFVGPRLGLLYRQRVGDWRLEGGGNLGASRAENHSTRDERRADGSLLRSQQDDSVSRESTFSLNGKATRLLGREGAEHSLVMGAEVESARRRDTRTTLYDGVIAPPTQAEIGDEFEASTLRLAVFAQDEWNLSPNWALNVGLRWEGITTQGDDGLGNRPQNRNGVATPLLHLLWKPDPKKRDQVRLSLTRSWRSPATNTLIGRPSFSRLYDRTLRSNVETSPDSAGNPNLKPELATGLDLAFERYLEGGGLLSANLFTRRLKDLMRSEVQLENVAWSAFPRYVRRTRNIGSASTEGLELEAKFRLDQWISGAPRTEMRANASFYRSRVDSVPGPDNRLDQQSRATANIGADHRFRGTPLTVGGNLNWVPETTTRLAADETSTVSTKRQWDLYALYSFSPTIGLRLMGNNVDPRDYSTLTFNDQRIDASQPLERTRVLSGGPSYLNLQLRLEMKL